MVLKKYLKPKSLTWWTGVSCFLYGFYNLDMEMIFTGLAAIGIRGAITSKERGL